MLWIISKPAAQYSSSDKYDIRAKFAIDPLFFDSDEKKTEFLAHLHFK